MSDAEHIARLEAENARLRGAAAEVVRQGNAESIYIEALLRAIDGLISALSPTSTDAGADALERFGHHPNAAIDFCIEVEELEGEVRNLEIGFTNGTPSLAEVQRRIAFAMLFRVGGDEKAVHAKHILRGLEKRALALSPTSNGGDTDG